MDKLLLLNLTRQVISCFSYRTLNNLNYRGERKEIDAT